MEPSSYRFTKLPYPVFLKSQKELDIINDLIIKKQLRTYECICRLNNMKPGEFILSVDEWFLQEIADLLSKLADYDERYIFSTNGCDFVMRKENTSSKTHIKNEWIRISIQETMDRFFKKYEETHKKDNSIKKGSSFNPILIYLTDKQDYPLFVAEKSYQQKTNVNCWMKEWRSDRSTFAGKSMFLQNGETYSIYMFDVERICYIVNVLIHALDEYDPCKQRHIEFDRTNPTLVYMTYPNCCDKESDKRHLTNHIHKVTYSIQDFINTTLDIVIENLHFENITKEN